MHTHARPPRIGRGPLLARPHPAPPRRGHLARRPSDALPGPSRDALVDDSDGRLYDEAMDIIERDYYRRSTATQLLEHVARVGAVKSLDDRFSNYFDPKDYTQLPGGHERRASRASA